MSASEFILRVTETWDAKSVMCIGYHKKKKRVGHTYSGSAVNWKCEMHRRRVPCALAKRKCAAPLVECNMSSRRYTSCEYEGGSGVMGRSFRARP